MRDGVCVYIYIYIYISFIDIYIYIYITHTDAICIQVDQFCKTADLPINGQRNTQSLSLWSAQLLILTGCGQHMFIPLADRRAVTKATSIDLQSLSFETRPLGQICLNGEVSKVHLRMYSPWKQ